MKRLETWLGNLLADFGEQVLEFGREEAQIWGRLCVPHPKTPSISRSLPSHSRAILPRSLVTPATSHDWDP